MRLPHARLNDGFYFRPYELFPVDLIVAFFSGLFASFSPCVVVLIPLMTYRFVESEQRSYKSFLLLALGFLVTYLLLGYFLSGVFVSEVQNGFKLGLGILFAILGLLAFLNRLNPMDLPIFKNAILAGAVFSLIISVNPCTLPFLGIVIATNGSSAVIANLLAFGMGLLVPAILFAFVGSSILKMPRKGSKLYHYVNRLMSLLLLGSGAYLALSIRAFDSADIYVVAGLLLLSFLALMKAFFIVNQKEDLKRPRNLLYMASMLLIILASIVHCSSVVSDGDLEQAGPQVCSYSPDSGCEICGRCTVIFAIAAALGVAGTVLAKFRAE